jgi:hypothetical protein
MVAKERRFETADFDLLGSARVAAGWFWRLAKTIFSSAWTAEDGGFKPPLLVLSHRLSEI